MGAGAFALEFAERVSLGHWCFPLCADADHALALRRKSYVPLPKSDTPSRIASNADIFGFELDDQEMAKLDGKDLGSKGAVAPNNVDCP